MKKYRKLVIVFILLYVALAALLWGTGRRIRRTQDASFRIAAARLCTDFQNQPRLPDKLDETVLDRFRTKAQAAEDALVSVWYLPAQEEDPAVLGHFYGAQNRTEMLVLPVFQAQRPAGYLRFNYVHEDGAAGILAAGQIILAVLFVCVLGLFIYIYRMILRPFHTISQVPYELSRGNLTMSVKETKNRYFGRFIWGIGMLRDTLDSQRRRELKLVRDKKMLLLSISHDIKTPLNAISLYAKALEESIYETPGERRQALAKIQEKTMEINRFVQEIVRTQTEDTVSVTVNNSEFYLADLMDKVQAAYAEKCFLNHCSFQVGPYENCLLTGDFDRAFEAVGNLFENAFKYGDGRKLTLWFSREEDCQLIHVYNSGSPVAMNQMPHLFDSFFRGTNTEGKEGNGLGLYISSEIMRKMQGDLYAVRHEDGMEFVLVCKIS